jgi:hypothetical protein
MRIALSTLSPKSALPSSATDASRSYVRMLRIAAGGITDDIPHRLADG